MCSRCGELGLLLRRLRADADERRAVARELGLRVAEGAALRRAAARPRDVVPALEQRHARHAGARVDIDDDAARARPARGRPRRPGWRAGRRRAPRSRAGDPRRRRPRGREGSPGGWCSPFPWGHSRVWSARVPGLRVRVPDRRRRLGGVRARRAAERGRAPRVPGRGRPRLRALRGRALAARHPRRAPARLLARVGDRARGPLAAARADHGRLLGAQRVRRPRRRAGRLRRVGRRLEPRGHRSVSGARRARAAGAALRRRGALAVASGLRSGRRCRRRSCTRSTTWARCAGTPPSRTSTLRAGARA